MCVGSEKAFDTPLPYSGIADEALRTRQDVARQARASPMVKSQTVSIMLTTNNVQGIEVLSVLVECMARFWKGMARWHCVAISDDNIRSVVHVSQQS